MYNVAFRLSVLSTLLSHVATSSRFSIFKPDRSYSPSASQKSLAKLSLDGDVYQQHETAFRSFQSNYLFVYLLAVAADWIQGPYVYALYSHYGYEKNNIARLYIAGFASSAIFGTFVASIADKYGRRNNAIVYCITYILSCATKHSSNFYVLLLGRILGGVAYSILFSAFEAWMVYEHHARAFDPSHLATTFARAQFGNGIVAILSGQLAGWFAYYYGKVMPFDISISILLLLTIVLMATWRENYGDAALSVHGGFSRAIRTLISDRKILLLGIAQAAFEGAMYTFTFVWTPALQTAGGQTSEIPHGTIFSTFMACTMIGSNLFTLVSRFIRVEELMRVVFILGAGVFIAATFRQHVQVTYICFLAFELLCGIYFPGMATARAPYIPEESRSALLTFFRIPLNIIVVIALYEDMDVKSVFSLCAVLMSVAAASIHCLIIITRRSASKDNARAPDEAADDECGCSDQCEGC